MVLMMKKLFLLFTTLLMVMSINCHTAKGKEIEVVCDFDFTAISNNFWDEWSATRKFNVGDTLVFSYVPGWTELYRVTAEDYATCYDLEPLATLSNSSQSGLVREARFKIKESGEFYFLSRFAYELPCESTFKLHIHVPGLSSTTEQVSRPSLNDPDTSNIYASSPSSTNPNKYNAYVSSPSSNAPTPTPFDDLNSHNAPVPSPSSSTRSRSNFSHSHLIIGIVLAVILVFAIVALVVTLCR